MTWESGRCELREANAVLAEHHYLGPIRNPSLVTGLWHAGTLMAVQAWGNPTSRRLPSDGTWLELKRWCIVPHAPANTGSRQHGQTVRVIRREVPDATTLVSYSDPSVGHTGALYRACNWVWSPTWLRLRPPPTGNGNWGKDKRQSPKDRWVFLLAHDLRRGRLLSVSDAGAIRRWLAAADDNQLRWAEQSPAPDLVSAVRRHRMHNVQAA